MADPISDKLAEMARALIDDGKLIEAGFVGVRIACIDPAAPPEQLHELRMFFFAGALHVFNSIMTMMGEGAETDAADFARLDKINKELQAFGKEFELHHLPAMGTG